MSITTLTIKDGLGANRVISAIDVAGDGSGPFLPVHGLANSAGTAIDPATSAKQDALIALLPTSIGQKTTAASLSVTLSSNHGNVPVSATALPLPTGAATAAKQDSLFALFPATIGQKASAASLSVVIASDQGSLGITASSLPLPTGAATAAKQDSIIALLPTSIGQKVSTNSISVVLASNHGSITTSPSADQDPIFDHTNGTKTSVTVSATVITPPTNCKFVRISTDVDVYVNTAGNPAVDDGTTIRIVANSPEVIPVVAGTAVTALSSSGTAVVRCTPLKVR